MRSGSGAPSYHHTIMYYINSPDWNVHLFTTDKTNMELSIASEGKVHLFTTHLLIQNGVSKPKLNHIFKRLKHIEFIHWAEKEFSKYYEIGGDNYIYAYEIWGVEAAKRISVKFAIPLITRFQGTVLCNENDTVKNRLLRYPHYEALQTRADLIVMTDDGTFGNNVIRRLGNSSRCLFIRNGLDLYSSYEEVRNTTDIKEIRESMNMDEGVRILFMSSRLTSWKRVDRGIKALYEVLKIRNDVRLVIAGDGDAKKSLESLTYEYGISRYVLFLGSILQKELYKYMLASDIFMSLYDIGNLGNPTFEAMLMGRPIIALNNGSTCTVLADGENSRLLEVDEIDRLPQLIIHLLNSPMECERIGKAAFKYAIDNFYTWEDRLRREENEIIKLGE